MNLCKGDAPTFMDNKAKITLGTRIMSDIAGFYLLILY